MSSPKKVLLFCQDDSELCSKAYTLQVRGFQVWRTGDLGCVRALALSVDFDCAVAFCRPHEADVGELALQAVMERQTEARTLLALPLARAIDTKAHRICDSSSMAQVLEAVRVLCARQRGPKKRNPDSARVELPAVGIAG